MMKNTIQIQPIRAGETGKAVAFLREGERSTWSRDQLQRMGATGCVLGAHQGSRLAGVAGLDPQAHRMLGPWLAPDAPAKSTLEKLVTAIERLAVDYGVRDLQAEDTPGPGQTLQELGYSPTDANKSGDGRTLLRRSIVRRITRYGRQVSLLNEALGIPRDYGARHWLRLHPEASKLVSIGKDIYERPQRMTPAAASAWKGMIKSAHGDDVELQPVSAFRSVDYQAGIVRRKLERGQSMEEIIRVSAAPGYSEHHSGRAIDVTTPDAEVLEESFEDSEAFKWLCANAAAHGFSLSYPRNNIHGIAYEPWHWAWSPDVG